MRLMVAYHGSYLPEHVDMDMLGMRRMGVDEVLISCQENDFRHMTGKVANAPALGHARGLKVMANFWGYACAFGGGKMSLLLLEEPDVWTVGPDGERRPRGCINHPKLIARAQEQVDACVDSGFDGFFWDEPSRQECFCPYCQAAFEAGGGKGALLEASPEEQTVFRKDTIVNYVQAMCDYVKAKDTGLFTATCLMPRDRFAWKDTASVSTLDSFGTDPYWLVYRHRPDAARRALGTYEALREVTESGMAEARAAGKQFNLWLNCWGIWAGEEQEIYDGGKILASYQPDILGVWSYRGGEGTAEACQRPALAWTAVERLYLELSLARES